MNKFLITLSLLLSSLVSLSQRVDLDKFNFTAIYRNFPVEPLGNDYKTYNVRIEASPSIQGGVNTSNLDQVIDIAGLKRVAGTGHITVLAMLDDIIFEKSETRERIDITKDKQGNEIRKPYYSAEITYSFSARASVYDYKGNTILSNYVLYGRENKSIYKTPEFASSGEANNKLLDTRTSLSRQLVNAALTGLNNTLNTRYGYTVQRINDILWVLNNRKHSEYEGHQKAWNSFRNAIVLMSADEPLNKVKEKMQPAIDYFEKIKSRYTTSSKEDRKLRYASYYNLAKIYLYLDDPQAAIQEADALAMNDFDEKDGRSIRSLAENLEAVFHQNNTRSRHFAVDITRYEPPVK